jgi:GDP/UDP-N,N'-diacetylbacillosamine 2-epimerase (hydrolysing)
LRKICVITGGRADYGLLSVLLREIRKSQNFKLQLIATGSHFSRKFGLTYREILKDGFKIDAKVDMKTNSDSAEGLGASMAIGLKGIARALVKLRPDILILLGDRYETMCAAAAGVISGIPIAHIHGGELTEGAYDDAFRHAITKMSQIHFVSTAVYEKRVIQMGEQPSRVFRVGALGVDNVLATPRVSRRELEKLLHFRFQPRNLLVTFHPATLEPAEVKRQALALLQSLQTLPKTGLIFTMPGADKASAVIWRQIRAFVKRRPHSKAFRALGSQIYLSCMREADGVVGNSSSGLLEAPVLKKPVVNIGNRQLGRLAPANVVSCPATPAGIRRALRKILSKKFKRRCAAVKTPFGSGGTARRMVARLRRLPCPLSCKKQFLDLL